MDVADRPVSKRQQIGGQLAAERAKEKELRSINPDVHFAHLRPPPCLFKGKLPAKGGITVAFVMPQRKKDKMVTMAFAVCSPQDVFCKRRGRLLALEQMLAGRCVTLPVMAKGVTGVGGTIHSLLDDWVLHNQRSCGACV